MKEEFQNIGEVADEIYTSTTHTPSDVALRRGNVLSDYYVQISQQEGIRAGNYFEINRESGEITIFDTNNQPINRILPPGMTILNVPGASRYSARDRRVEVDSEILTNSGEYGKAMLAHEIGHAFDEENMERYAAKAREYNEKEPKAQPRERIGMWNDYFIAEATIEITAWDEGKIVSDLLGVDSQVYDDLMECALVHRWSSIVSDFYEILDKNLPLSKKDIKQSLRRFLPFAGDRKYILLNPITQQIEQFTFKELEAIRNQAIIDRKKADVEFNRKLIRTGIETPIKSVMEQRYKDATVISSSIDVPVDSKWKN
jgi:hypothetical protein